MRFFRLGLIFLLQVGISLNAWAILDLEVNESLPVYLKPSSKSKQISQLDRGDKVVISPKSYGSFRKVLIRYKGKRRGGYIPSRLIVKSRIEERLSKGQTLYGSRGYNKTVGIAFNLSQMYMQEKSFSTSATDTYDIAEFKSGQGYLNLTADWPLKPGRSFRFLFSLRSVKFAGEASLRGVVGATTHYDVSMERSFIGLGGEYRVFPNLGSSFWWGVGLEYDHSSEAKITIKGSNGFQQTSTEAAPAWVIGFVDIGWEVGLTQTLFFAPQFKFGMVLNNDPIVLDVEGSAGLVYRY